MLRAAGEIPGALFRFHCQDNGQRDMRQWPLAVAARPHRCRNQLHAAILGTSRGSSNRRRQRQRRRRCRRNSRSRSRRWMWRMSIRKKDIVCCNIVMTLTMAAHRTPRTGGHPLMRPLMKHSTMQIAISCRKKQQQQQRGGADNCAEVEQGCAGRDRSVQEDNASHVTNTCPATAKCN